MLPVVPGSRRRLDVPRVRREGGGVERHRCEPAARGGGGPERLSADCQANAVGWEAPAVRPRVVKCDEAARQRSDRPRSNWKPGLRPRAEMGAEHIGDAHGAGAIASGDELLSHPLFLQELPGAEPGARRDEVTDAGSSGRKRIGRAVRTVPGWTGKACGRRRNVGTW